MEFTPQIFWWKTVRQCTKYAEILYPSTLLLILSPSIRISVFYNRAHVIVLLIKKPSLSLRSSQFLQFFITQKERMWFPTLNTPSILSLHEVYIFSIQGRKKGVRINGESETDSWNKGNIFLAKICFQFSIFQF